MKLESLQEYFEIVNKIPNRIKNKKVNIINMLFSEQEHKVALKVEIKGILYEGYLQINDKSNLEYINSYELEEVNFMFKANISEILLYEILNCFQTFVRNYIARKYTPIENNMQRNMLCMLYEDNL
nr:MAG TPA: hypothetical protein [Ackermannviridae sp.]